MRLFRKSRPKAPTDDAPNEMSALVHSLLRRITTPIAAALSRGEQKMSARQKKIAIAVFCLVAGMISLSILYHGLYDKGGSGPGLLKTPGISFPVSPQLPDSLQERLRRPRHARLPVGMIPPDSLIK